MIVNPGLDTSCLYSIVRNISGETRNFPFLPPHGKRLADNEEFVCFGDIRNRLGNDIGFGNHRAQLAFERALHRGLMEIVHTPAPILESQNGTIRTLRLNNNGSLSAVAPCWTHSVSDSDSAFDAETLP